MTGYDNELWMQLDELAASYERAHGVRPNHLRVGTAVAIRLEGREPGPREHPLHVEWVAPSGSGVWFPARPERLGWWSQRRHERACRRLGGHWWHPADAMITWFCCLCGKETDGMPQDGSRG